MGSDLVTISFKATKEMESKITSYGKRRNLGKSSVIRSVLSEMFEIIDMKKIHEQQGG